MPVRREADAVVMSEPIPEQIASDVAYAVAKKAQDVVKDQGEAAVQMIRDAAQQTDPSRLLDVYA